MTLRGGIPVRFGNGREATQKWAAAAAVLADPKLDGLTYVDVRVPERAAAGGASPSPDADRLSTVGRVFRVYVNSRSEGRGFGGA